MSYQRYGYSSPYGSRNYEHSSYTSPTGNNSYSSTTRSSSSQYSTPSRALGGSLSNLSSSLITPSRTSTYSSSPYSSSLYSNRSTYDSSRPYSSSRYSGDFSSGYSPSSSLYSPSSPSSGYSRSKYLSDSTSSYTPRSSRPSYDVDTTSSKRSTDIDTSSSTRKSRYTDDDISDYKPKKRAEKTEDVSTKTSSETTETRRRRREKVDEDEGSAPSRSAATDVSAVTKQTESMNLESKSSPSPKPAGSPKPVPSSNKTTELPHGDGVATKGTSAMNQQSADPDKIPVCAKCGIDIRGPFVLALNKSWCPHHFTCSKCDSELVNMGFVELNGSIYCENDYETFYAPKCAKCRKAIVGDTVNALDKTWHPACFVCNECGCPISSGAFHVEDGMPYCMNDWSRLFQTKCTGCTFPVEPGDKWIEALDANWHSECFVCGTCKNKLEGQPFYPRDGKPFCKEHAQG